MKLCSEISIFNLEDENRWTAGKEKALISQGFQDDTGWYRIMRWCGGLILTAHATLYDNTTKKV